MGSIICLICLIGFMYFYYEREIPLWAVIVIMLGLWLALEMINISGNWLIIGVAILYIIKKLG